MKMYKSDRGWLYNEDCIKVLSNVKDNSIDFILTDPPYFIANEVTLIRRSNKMKYKGKDLYLDEKWDQQWDNRGEYKDWLGYILKEFHRVLKPDKHMVIWGDGMLVGWMMEEWEKLGGKYRNPLFWRKTNPVPRARKVDMMSSIEMAMWGTKGKVKVKNYNWQLGMINDVFDCGIPRKQGSPVRHPTQKPLQIALYLIAYLSKAGDVVLDPFAGSGTFLVSSALLGRKYIGVEKEEKYIGWIKHRLNNLQDVYPLLDKFVDKVLEKKNKNTSMGEVLDILGKPERLISIPRMLF